MIEAVKYILKDGGALYLETPNWSRALVPFLDTFFWNDYTHIRIFTKAAMRRLLADYDFNILYLNSLTSAAFVVPGDSLGKTKAIYVCSGILSFAKKITRAAFQRIIGSILRDALVVCAVNKK